MPANGGSPGTGGGESISPPDGCRIENQALGTGFCILGLLCDSAPVETICKARWDGIWYCQCSDDPLSGYLLSGTSDLSACAASADICRSSEEPVLGPEICQPELANRSASRCSIERVCERELEGTSAAIISSFNDVVCTEDASGRLLCYCNQSRNQYSVAQDGQTACDTVFELCDEPLEPVFEGAELDCQPLSRSIGPDYCSLRDQCTSSMTLDDGVSVMQTDELGVNCQQGPAVGSICSCSSSTSHFRVDREERVKDVSSCSDLSDLCLGLLTGDFALEPTCTVAVQSARGSHCNAQLECSASATVSGGEVSALGYLTAECDLNDDSWNCVCSSGLETASFEGRGSSAWDVCTDASDRCAGAVKVQFGNGGMSVPPPGPPIPAP
jgi:hypothetical protein